MSFQRARFPSIVRPILRVVSGALLAGCAASAPADTNPAPSVVVGVGSGTPVASAGSSVIEVLPAEVPADFALDGVVGEWGLVQDGAPRLSVAVTEKGVTVAGSVAANAADGLWLAIASRVPELPPIGEWTRGGGVQELDCENERDYIEGSYVPNGKKHPPEIVAACEKLLETYAQQQKDHAARFRKRILVQPSSVRAGTDEEHATEITGSKVAWKRGPRGATFEATLPVAALPRLSEAPLVWLALWAGTKKAPPSIEPPEEAFLPLAASIGFEPHAGLRAHVFEELGAEHYVGDLFFQRSGASYHPTEPLEVTTMHYLGSNNVEPTSERLYERKFAMGDIEVGVVQALFRSVAVIRKGEVLGRFSTSGGFERFDSLRGVVPRDGEIHIGLYEPGGYTMMTGGRAPSWTVIAVAADGTIRENVVDDAIERATSDPKVRCSYGGPGSFGAGVASSSATLDTFSVRFSCSTEKKRAGVEVTWRWDQAKKQYVGNHKVVPPPKDDD